MITYWKPGEPRPSGEPRRYYDRHGYVILRWKIGPGRYIGTREHIWIAGEPGKDVHHLNGVRDDNRPENLIALTPQEHQAIHAAQNRVNDERIVALYLAGLSQPKVAEVVGCNSGTVSRVLARQGVPARRSHPRRLSLPEDAIVEMLRLGMRVGAVAKALGYGREAVDRVRREHGIPPFRPGRPEAS